MVSALRGRRPRPTRLPGRTSWGAWIRTRTSGTRIRRAARLPHAPSEQPRIQPCLGHSERRPRPRVRVHTPTGRVLLLSALAVVVGLAAGGAAWALLHLIGLLTNFALFHRFGWAIPSFANFHPGIGFIVAAVVGALLVSLLAQWAPAIRGTGSPRRWRRSSPNRAGSHPERLWPSPSPRRSAIGTGGPFGAEGPDHRDRRCVWLLDRPAPATVALRTKDPACYRSGGRHGRNLRSTSGRSGPCPRAPPVRVLDARLRPAGRGLERRRGPFTSRSLDRAPCSPSPPSTSPGSRSSPST